MPPWPPLCLLVTVAALISSTRLSGETGSNKACLVPVLVSRGMSCSSFRKRSPRPWELSGHLGHYRGCASFQASLQMHHRKASGAGLERKHLGFDLAPREEPLKAIQLSRMSEVLHFFPEQPATQDLPSESCPGPRREQAVARGRRSANVRTLGLPDLTEPGTPPGAGSRHQSPSPLGSWENRCRLVKWLGQEGLQV